MTLRDRARRLVEGFPAVAQSYRTLRNIWTLRARRPERSPLGFDLLSRPDMVSGRFEEEETQLVSSLLGQADVFVDVGANIGLYTILAATRGVWTLAVEPLPENLSYLTANVLLNRLQNVEVFPVAVSDRPGVLPLFGGDTGASLVEGWAGSGAGFQTAVAISTLDVLLGARFDGKRVLVKIDVEGAEAGTLAGAARLLRQKPAPTWLVEVCLTEHHPAGQNPRFREVFDLFWSAGYRAQTADAARREVTPADVARWVSSGKRDFGGYNFLFSQA
jgi:FkbM family methyltransferase